MPRKRYICGRYLAGRPAAGVLVPELSMGGLAGLRYKQLLANEPDGPALRRQSGPQPDGAVPAEVELAPPGHAVDGPDPRAAPVTCLVHDVTPAAVAPGPGTGGCTAVIAVNFTFISESVARPARTCRPLAGGHLGGELADPAHALGGGVGVVAELLGHPAKTATDADAPHDGLDCFCCHCDARGVRALQPGREQRRPPCVCDGPPGRLATVGRSGGRRVPPGCHQELSGAGRGRCAQPVREASGPGARC